MAIKYDTAKFGPRRTMFISQGYKGNQSQNSYNKTTPIELDYARSSSFYNNNKSKEQLQGNCYKCRKPGHWKRECTSKSYNNNNTGYSYNSNKGKSKFNNLEE